jgi:hypothetical protein
MPVRTEEARKSDSVIRTSRQSVSYRERAARISEQSERLPFQIQLRSCIVKEILMACVESRTPPDKHMCASILSPERFMEEILEVYMANRRLTRIKPTIHSSYLGLTLDGRL